MMKKLLTALLAVMMAMTLASGALADLNVSALKGPTSMGMVPMMETEGLNFTICAAIDEITPKLVKGETDLAAVPANLAAVLYNNTQGRVKVLAINTLGVLYIVGNGETGVTCAADLKGRTIYSSGKGATPEYALNYLLTENGMTPGVDVFVEYKSEHSECLASLLANEGSVAMLPQPFVTTAQMKQPQVQIVLDLNEEWAKLQEGKENPSALLTGVLVGRADVLTEKSGEVAAFMAAYKDSVAYVNANTAEAAELIEKYGIIPAAVAKKALPYCCITCIDGTEMQQKLSGYLSVLFEQNPKAVGGTLPDEAFYWIP